MTVSRAGKTEADLVADEVDSDAAVEDSVADEVETGEDSEADEAETGEDSVVDEVVTGVVADSLETMGMISSNLENRTATVQVTVATSVAVSVAIAAETLMEKAEVEDSGVVVAVLEEIEEVMGVDSGEVFAVVIVEVSGVVIEDAAVIEAEEVFEEEVGVEDHQVLQSKLTPRALV